MTTTGVRYREYAPDPRLAMQVECYWDVRDPVAQATRKSERIVPDACPEFIIHLADPFRRRIGDRWISQRRMFLAGTLSRPWELKPGRRIDTVGIRFRPGAITCLFPIEMRSAADRETSLDAIVGVSGCRGLTRDLAAASGRERARCLDAWLVPRLDRPAPRGQDRTHESIRRILARRGRQRIEEVAAQVGISRRRLERLFARDLGIRPKLFARIVRLNAALARLEQGDREAAVNAALDAGYFDQAHMSRDFQAVAGRTPGARRSEDGALARHFTRPERILAWLAGE